jgi:hypothetical protein
MFEYLAPHRYILVTGPHRSGTTIAARMIVEDLAIDYYEEEDVFYFCRTADVNKVDLGAFLKTVEDGPLVLRCPALCSQVHKYAGVEGLFVVLMVRPVNDILASQLRVRWGFEAHELKAYPGARGPVARVKYDFWHEVQAPALEGKYAEVAYGDLAGHPMWVPKERRVDFYIRQFREGEPRGTRFQLSEADYRRASEKHS